MPTVYRVAPRRIGPLESPLTFTQGLSRNGNTVTNDVITGKAGGQAWQGGTNAGDSLDILATAGGNGPILFELSAMSVGLVDVTLASAAALQLNRFVVSGPNVTITGATAINTATGFNLNVFNAPTIVSPVNIGAGTTAAATVVIAGAPTISGGGAFNGLSVALWLQGANANLQVDGAAVVSGPSGLLLNNNGGNGLQITSGTTTITLNAGGFSIGGTALNFPINIASSTSNLLFQGNGTEAFRIFGNAPAGRIQFAAANLAANGTGAGLAFGSVAPAGAHVNPQEWLTVMGSAGTQRWIPMF